MLEKIKKGFKWIADHTGISWIVSKISSGLNSLKNWWSSNDASKASSAKPNDGTSTQHQSNPEQELQASIRVIGDKGLALVVEQDKESLVKGSKNPKNTEEYLLYIKCDKGMFRITGMSTSQKIGNGTHFSINSVANQDSMDVSGDLTQMKTMLGLDDNKKSIEISKISKTQLISKVEGTAAPVKTTEAESSVPAANSNTPSSETTAPDAKKVVDNGHSK